METAFPTTSPTVSPIPTAMRKVLIVSPAFPPLNTPDLQRIRMSLPYYRAHGWEPTVLTVDHRLQDGVLEPALTETIPGDVRVVTCGALPLKLCRIFGVGNLGLRSWLHLLVAGARILRRERFDLVFFSTTQFVTFLLGRIWRRVYRVPYVIDLQDPWRTDYYERPGVRKPPGGWKYRFAKMQATAMEGWVLRRTAALMSVSQSYIDDLGQRYPWFAKKPTDVIRFGTSERDLEVARRTHSEVVPPAPEGTLRFIYTGAAGPITPHSANVVFRALQRFQEMRPREAKYLRLEFIGTSYAAPAAAVCTVKPLADALGVGERVIEIPHRVGHLDCLRLQSEADALLLLGSSDLAYSPSKLYPYFLANRPMLGVVFRNSQLESILEQLNCAVLAKFEDGSPTGPAEEIVCDFFAAAFRQFPTHFLPVRNTEFFKREYLARSLTARQTALFERACPPPLVHGRSHS